MSLPQRPPELHDAPKQMLVHLRLADLNTAAEPRFTGKVFLMAINHRADDFPVGGQLHDQVLRP